MKLRNRTGEERRRQTLCDKRDNNFAWKNLPPNFTFPKTDLFVEEHKMSMLREFPTKHASKSPVTFVTLKRFAVLFFLPSCWVNSPVPPLPDLPAESLSTAPYIAIGRGQRCQVSLGRCCAGSVLLLVQVLLSLVWNSLLHKQRKIRPRPHQPPTEAFSWLVTQSSCGWRRQNMQTRNETSWGVSQQVKLRTILRVAKQENHGKPKVTANGELIPKTKIYRPKIDRELK